MALITPIDTRSAVQLAFTPVTLTSSDTMLALDFSLHYQIQLTNPTGGTLTVNFLGADSGIIPVPGGGNGFNSGVGYDVVLTTLQNKVVNVDRIRAYLQGAITITGGAGATMRFTSMTREL
jgi:hypothetical protein